jgi:hypothetical protein
MTPMKIADQYFAAKQKLDAMQKLVDGLKAELNRMGPGEIDGDFATVTVTQRADSVVFDAKAAWEHVAEHLSPQLRTATLRKFTGKKPGVLAVTVKGKAPVILEPEAA